MKKINKEMVNKIKEANLADDMLYNLLKENVYDKEYAPIFSNLVDVIFNLIAPNIYNMPFNEFNGHPGDQLFNALFMDNDLKKARQIYEEYQQFNEFSTYMDIMLDGK